MNEPATTFDVEAARRASRRAYELGRARTGVARGAVVALAVTALAAAAGRVTSLAEAWPWATVAWLAWAALEWRGGAMRTGGLRGAIAGAVTLVLPMTWLRPCCAPGEAPGLATVADGCCAQPGACGLAGAIVGLLAAAALPRVAFAGSKKSVEAVAGVFIGAGAIAAVRCAALLAGEAVGLGAGLVAGVAAAALARAWLASRSVTSPRA